MPGYSGYNKGDYWLECWVCGVRILSSDSTMRWDRKLMHAECWDPRHEQDFVRGVPDRQRVPHPQPETVDEFVTATPGALMIDAKKTNLWDPSPRYLVTETGHRILLT